MTACALLPEPSISRPRRRLHSKEKGIPVGTIRIPRYNTVLPPCIDLGMADLCAWLRPPSKTASGRSSGGSKVPPEHHCPVVPVLDKCISLSAASVDEVNHVKDESLAESDVLDQGMEFHPLGLMAYATYTSATGTFKSLHQSEHSMRISIHTGEAVKVWNTGILICMYQIILWGAPRDSKRS